MQLGEKTPGWGGRVRTFLRTPFGSVSRRVHRRRSVVDEVIAAEESVLSLACSFAASSETRMKSCCSDPQRIPSYKAELMGFRGLNW